MPELPAARRAQGAYTAETDLWHDHDWTTPTNLETLRHRPLPTPNQTRYGPPPNERFPSGSPPVPNPPEPSETSGSPAPTLPP